MTVTVTLTQQSLTDVRLDWVTDEPNPVVRWDILRTIPISPVNPIYLYYPAARTFIYYLDPALGLSDGDPLEFTVKDQTTAVIGTVAGSYSEFEGIVNPLESAARYTDVATVKEQLRIPATNSALDARILTAILAAEYGIDAELGVSFPNVDVPGIPSTIIQAATSVSVQIYKSGDAPTGTAGGDSMYGELDVSELVRREIQSNPLLKGLRVSWGVS